MRQVVISTLLLAVVGLAFASKGGGGDKKKEKRVPRISAPAWKMASLAHWKARVVTVDSTIAGILYGCGGGSGSATGAGLPEPPTRSGWGLTALFQNRTARSTIR